MSEPVCHIAISGATVGMLEDYLECWCKDVDYIRSDCVFNEIVGAGIRECEHRRMQENNLEYKRVFDESIFDYTYVIVPKKEEGE